MKAFYLIPLLAFSACSSPKPALVLRPEPPPAMEGNSAFRYPEVVQAYHVGRYVDPNDDLVMHERHVLYRVEVNARWNLHACPLGGDVPAPMPARDAAFSPAPVNDDILAEVNDQKLATLEITVEAKRLTSALAQFQAALRQTQTNWQEMAALRVEVSRMRTQLDALEAATNAPPTAFASTNKPSEALAP